MSASITHGDCRNVLRENPDMFGGRKIDCLLTDPPYGVDFQSTYGKNEEDRELYQRKITDDGDVDVAIESFDETMQLMVPHLADECEMYIFSQWQVSPEWHKYLGSLAEHGIELRQLIIWEKGYPGIGDVKYNWGCGHEFIYYLKKGKRRVPYRRSGILHIDKVRPGTNVHPCLPPDEMVMTPMGYRPIKEIPVGGLVLAADGRYHSVTDATESWCDDGVVEVKAAGSMGSTTTTRNHPWLVWRPTKKANSIVGHEVLWADASDVVVGDYAMSPIPPESGSISPVSEDKAWASGLWLAEGHLNASGNSKNRYLRWTVHANVADLYAKRIQTCTDAKVSVYPSNVSESASIVTFDAAWALEVVRWCGLGAHDKFISPEVLSWARREREAFLDGYLDGDGWRRKGAAHRAKSVSDDLVATIRGLAEGLGYFFSVKRDGPGKISHIDGRAIKPGSCWSMEFVQPGGTDRRPKWATHEGTEFSLHRVQSVEHQDYRGVVLNLSVEGSHTFMTKSGMTHNTQKPTALLKILIEYSTDPGAFVFDPYAGSGSTLVAAEELGRDSLGIEREADYVATARTRLAQGGLFSL